MVLLFTSGAHVLSFACVLSTSSGLEHVFAGADVGVRRSGPGATVDVSSFGLIGSAIRRQNQKRGGALEEYSEASSVFGGMVNVIGYTKHAGLNCLHDDEEANLETGAGHLKMSLSQCKARCAADDRCTCMSFDNTSGTCSLRSYCIPHRCVTSSLIDTYEQQANYTVDGVTYRRAGGWNCGNSQQTGQDIDTEHTAKKNVTASQCLKECNKDSRCSCVRYERYYHMTCWKRSGCPKPRPDLQKCNRTERYDTYIMQAKAKPVLPLTEVCRDPNGFDSCEGLAEGTACTVTTSQGNAKHGTCASRVVSQDHQPRMRCESDSWGPLAFRIRAKACEGLAKGDACNYVEGAGASAATVTKTCQPSSDSHLLTCRDVNRFDECVDLEEGEDCTFLKSNGSEVSGTCRFRQDLELMGHRFWGMKCVKIGPINEKKRQEACKAVVKGTACTYSKNSPLGVETVTRTCLPA